MAEQRWFTVRGWKLAMWPDYICASKLHRVSHSVRIEPEETTEQALTRLQAHVLQAYPNEVEL